MSMCHSQSGGLMSVRPRFQAFLHNGRLQGFVLVPGGRRSLGSCWQYCEIISVAVRRQRNARAQAAIFRRFGCTEAECCDQKPISSLKRRPSGDEVGFPSISAPSTLQQPRKTEDATGLVGPQSGAAPGFAEEQAGMDSADTKVTKDALKNHEACRLTKLAILVGYSQSAGADSPWLDVLL